MYALYMEGRKWNLLTKSDHSYFGASIIMAERIAELCLLSPFYKNIRLHLKRSSCVIYIFKHTELFWRKQTSLLPSWLTTLFNGREVIFHLTLLTLFATTRKALRRIPTTWKVSLFGVILVHIFPHSDQNNSEYGHFLRSAPSLMNLMTYHLTMETLIWRISV